jgi:type I restriction enzyme S subunit
MSAGWVRKALGEIALVGAGNSAPQDKELFENGTYPFFRTSDIGRVHIGTVVEAEDYLNERGIKRLALYPAGTILLPKSGASTFLDHRVIMGVDGYVSSHLATVRAKQGVVETKFLFYALLTVAARDLGVDSNYPTLSLAQVNAIEVSLPPLPEQQRIIAILDVAFAGLATATANAEKNLKNARELFDSYLNFVFTQKGVEWARKELGELAILSRGHNPPKRKFSSVPRDGYVRFYQIRDGKTDDYAVYVPVTPQLHRVNPNDILMVAYRHIGRAFRGASGAFNVALCKITNRDRDILNDDFLFHIIPTSLVRGELLKQAERSLIPSMSVEHLKVIRIPVPPIDEQERIVEGISRVEAEVERLDANYQLKLQDLMELKQRLLQKAFSGELTSPPSSAIKEAAE